MAELSDETLMAYADNELEKGERSRVEAIIARHPALLERLQAFTRTKAAVGQVFDQILAEPPSAELVAYVRALPIGASPVADLAQARAVQAQARRNQVSGLAQRPERRVSWTAAALAASVCLVIGGSAGWFSRTLHDGSATPGQIAEGKSADWPLQVALETVAGGTEGRLAGDVRVKPTLSFKTKGHKYCRQYEVGGSGRAGAEGVACRDGTGVWRVLAEQGVAGVAAQSSPLGVRPAGPGVASGVGAVVDRMIEGGVFDPQDEKRLLDGHWKP